MNIKTSIPKGTRDFSSSVMFRRNFIFETVRQAFERYGYAPIETPSMENIDTLTGKYGDEGDRLIFKILNSGDFFSKVKLDKNIDSKSLANQIVEKALRYDLTVPFARFVVQNRNDITFPFKRYQMQNVWRADKPQKGRYREFFQCDADVIGTDSLLCEIELIQLYDEVCSNLNIPNVEIAINNRKILAAMFSLMDATNLFDDLVIILDKIDKIGIDKVKEEMLLKGVKKEALSILDVFLNSEDINNLEPFLEKIELGKEGLEELQFIIGAIADVGLQSSKLVFDITLARGLNYYTGSILEVKVKDMDIGSIGGGGRYDNLTSIFGLKDVSGVGISFGIDRIYLVMEELALFPDSIDIKTTVMFINFGKKEAAYCLPLLKQLRLNGIRSELYPSAVKMKKQMNYANNKGVKFVIMIGEDEMDSSDLTLKNMITGEQKKLNVRELIKELS